MTETTQVKAKTPYLLMGFGATGFGFGTMGLLVTFAQRSMMGNLQSAKPPPEFMVQYMQNIHRLWLDWLPLLMVVGVVWGVVGFLLKNNEEYRLWAAGSILLAVAWISGYFYAASGPVAAVVQHIPYAGVQGYVQVMVYGSALLFFLVPAGVGFLLRREYF